MQLSFVTSRHGAVVSALDFGLEGRGFDSHKSHRDFSDSGRLLPRVSVLWAQWEDWDHTVELHPLYGCEFESVAQIT